MANKSIKGTKTEQNLAIAYMAESGAYSRYTYYAAQADKENYFPIGEIFRETAANELRHSKVYFKFLEGGSFDIKIGVDAGVIADTASNLATAAQEELTEGVELYANAAQGSRRRGLPRNCKPFPRHR